MPWQNYVALFLYRNEESNVPFYASNRVRKYLRLYRYITWEHFK